VRAPCPYELMAHSVNTSSRTADPARHIPTGSRDPQDTFAHGRPPRAPEGQTSWKLIGRCTSPAPSACAGRQQLGADDHSFNHKSTETIDSRNTPENLSFECPCHHAQSTYLVLRPRKCAVNQQIFDGKTAS